MKNPTIETLTLALTMRQDGADWPEILEATGLNYSQAWYFVESQRMREAGELVEGEITPQTIVDLRAAKHSWGTIAVMCQLPESRVRRMFTEASNLKSQGLRIGKGGRYFYGYSGEPLYSGELRPTGTAIPKDAKLEGALMAADTQRMIHEDIKTLRAKADELGISYKPRATKAQLVKLILAHEA